MRVGAEVERKLFGSKMFIWQSPDFEKTTTDARSFTVRTLDKIIDIFSEGFICRLHINNNDTHMANDIL